MNELLILEGNGAISLRNTQNYRLELVCNHRVGGSNPSERTFKSEPLRFRHEGSLFYFALIFNEFQLLRIRKMSRYILRI